MKTNKTENSKEEIYQKIMRSLTTWHDRKLGNKIVYDDECVRLALKDAIEQGYNQARHDLLIEVEKIIDEYKGDYRSLIINDFIKELKTKLGKLKDE